MCSGPRVFLSLLSHPVLSLSLQLRMTSSGGYILLVQVKRERELSFNCSLVRGRENIPEGHHHITYISLSIIVSCIILKLIVGKEYGMPKS